MSDKKHRVFVYGTLKRGIHNHRLLETSDFIGPASTVDEFRMFDVGFPVIRDDLQPGHRVSGEVYDVDDATLKRLDQLEAEGHMYDRKLINVVVMDGREIIDGNVSVYIGNTTYWGDKTPREYVSVNVNNELEWRAA